MLKRNTLSILGILFIILIFLVGIIRVLFATPYTEKSLLKIFFNKEKIIYLGDSVLNADFKNIKNPSSLVKLFESKINTNVLEISGASFNPYIYKFYIDTIKKYKNTRKLIVGM